MTATPTDKYVWDQRQNHFDVVVIGGGINGIGIALDAAGRGLKTFLCEMNDLSWATSSRSSKLIHGGLRYLENYQFRLVREALLEREVLLKKAPHIIRPLTFCLPHQPYLRPAWLIRAGLFLYDHLSPGSKLPSSCGVTFTPSDPLVEGVLKGFEYADAWVDDARLVILNAVDARQRGAVIKSRTRCISVNRQNLQWELTLEEQTGKRYSITSTALVNATGAWVTELGDKIAGVTAPKLNNKVRLVKGSHIVVPRLHDQPRAFILQNQDKRVVFVIPYEEQFSLIGTTDVEFQGDPNHVEASEEEIEYLLSICNDYFKSKINKKQVVKSFAGLRALVDDQQASPQAVGRDYTLILDDGKGLPPLLSVIGGKLTTYRRLAEKALNRLSPWFKQAKGPWTQKAPLAGGDFDDVDLLLQQFSKYYPWLNSKLLNRYVRSYGTLTAIMLKGATCDQDLGRHFGCGLYQKEVEYLLNEEWAQTSEDILWRRSKLGLRLDSDQVSALSEFIVSYLSSEDNSLSVLQVNK